ncbi:hypothetical protein [Planomonospora venezuelensis]|uniref:Secreted protein n=1 Tax=Planomonospora venezuelensis TaxID=1999 RepID=A0A841D1A7_PLAVE|nr:hypothetical protein [Planomonospora venezuelensis]MBB5964031.1 hypothetical protein [Planomonospora venezuelensis]GIM99653.1 hypothetical protein Pve01_13120 [Planomonospora venezuelensis]
MSAETLIWVVVIVVAVAAIIAVGYVVLQQRRRHRLRERFGPEYERTLQERENRREAEQELLAREQRFSSLDIRPLDSETREAYAKKWTEVQERFVDAPGFAVTEADHLVTAVMAERGYPTDDFEQRIADLSVAHGRTLDHYRQAHEISGRAVRKAASTEELRQAMVHYRALFQELLEAEEPHAVNGDHHAPRHAGPRREDARPVRGEDERAGQNERNAPRDSRGR